MNRLITKFGSNVYGHSTKRFYHRYFQTIPESKPKRNYAQYESEYQSQGQSQYQLVLTDEIDWSRIAPMSPMWESADHHTAVCRPLLAG